MELEEILNRREYTDLVDEKILSEISSRDMIIIYPTKNHSIRVLGKVNGEMYYVVEKMENYRILASGYVIQFVWDTKDFTWSIKTDMLAPTFRINDNRKYYGEGIILPEMDLSSLYVTS